MPGKNGAAPAAELDEALELSTEEMEDADDLASMPSLADLRGLLGDLPGEWVLENTAIHYLDLVGEANKSYTNMRANRAASNETQAKHWAEIHTAALAGIGRILRDHPKVRALAAEIAAVQVAQTRKNRAEFMAQHRGK